MPKVRSERLSKAACHDCSLKFEASLDYVVEDVARKHVRQTGHAVTVYTNTVYKP